METNITLQNSSEFYLNNEELFLRSIPAKLKVGPLTTDSLRLLVYYVTKASPYELAVESGNFEGTLQDWLESLQANLSFKATVETYADLATVTGLDQGDLAFVIESGRVYPFVGEGFPSEDKGLDITGDSAYQLAKKAGFVGTEAEWLASLKMTTDTLTPEELAQLKGEKGDTGDVGVAGDSAYTVYVKSVPEGETILNVPEWLASLKGDKGDTGPIGAAFTYSDFTSEQLVALTGPKGDQGLKGDTGAKGVDGTNGLDGAKGDKGDKGDAGEQGLRGLDGTNGLDGAKGDKGDKGDAFVYADFTPEQLTALKGPKGDTGENGVDGIDGAKGDKGEPGVDGIDGVTQNATTIVMTGLVTDDSTAVLDTDTLLVVIGKLQAQITALAARVTALESV